MVLTRKRRALEQQKTARSTADSLLEGVALDSRRPADVLLALPFDILLEVLRQCKPQDLLILSRLNKAWRETMRGGNINSRAVWTTVRRKSKIPEPPKGLTEPQWAALWLETFCQSCGISRGSIDWVLLKRVCGACKLSHLVPISRYRKWFPDYPKEYLDYVPHVRRGNVEHCWDEDVLKVARSFVELSHSSLEEWRLKRIEALEDRRTKHDETIRAHEGWQKMKKVEQNERALESCKDILRRLGYESIDIDVALNRKNKKVMAHLQNVYHTHSVYTLRYIYELDVQAAMARRLSASEEVRV